MFFYGNKGHSLCECELWNNWNNNTLHSTEDILMGLLTHSYDLECPIWNSWISFKAKKLLALSLSLVVWVLAVSLCFVRWTFDKYYIFHFRYYLFLLFILIRFDGNVCDVTHACLPWITCHDALMRMTLICKTHWKSIQLMDFKNSVFILVDVCFFVLLFRVLSICTVPFYKRWFCRIYVFRHVCLLFHYLYIYIYAKCSSGRTITVSF